MKKEDIEFLKNLQHEMLTQDTVGQADPRFWVVMHTVRHYGIENGYDIDGICVYDSYSAEGAYEGDMIGLVKWLKETFDIITKCNYINGFIEILCDDENKYSINKDRNECLENFFNEYDFGRYSVCNYKDNEEIVKDTMFLTLRECKEHIKANSYHYNKPRPYAMTAWRSPQVKRLYKILQETNWNELKEVIDNGLFKTIS